MGLASEFGLLFLLEARDAASEIFAKVDESLDHFSETAKGAAEVAAEAGAAIDEALGRTVSASDRLDVADARVAAAQAKAASSAQALTDAERELIAAQQEAADAGGEDAGAQARLVTMSAALTAAQRDAAVAAKGLTDAQADQSVALKAAAAAGDENAAATLASKDASEESSLSLGKVGKVAGLTAIGLGVAAGVMVKAAGDFQDSTTHLVTDAGESQKNLAMVQAGILKVSTATGQSASSITDAMYHIESSGFHASSGLAILKTVAEGARVGGADLDTTSKALVGTLTAYYGTSLTAAQATKDSTSVMNQLIATTGAGDMRMQDLASSLSAVTPVAAAAHISLAQVGGALATMTAQGMTAQQASQDLAHAIRSLTSPTNEQATEMHALGLNANSVAKNLGSTGLAGTLSQMRNAVLSNTSGGYVMLNLLKGMSPAAQGLSNQILAGTITTQGLTNAMKGLSPEQAAMVTRFKTSADSISGLKQTYTGAMSKMLGGATGLNVALMLTGKHMGDLNKATASVAAAARKSSGDVENWSTIQGTFAFKMSQAKTGIENTGIAIGSALLPAVTAVLSAVTKVLVPIAEWTAKHKTLTEILFGAVTAIAATIAIVAIAGKTIKAVKTTVDDLGKAYKGATAALQKLGGKSKQVADQQAGDAKKAASAQETASEQSAAAAETSAGEQEAASAGAAAAAEEDAAETAAANETAAAESSGSWITAAASAVAGWAVSGAKMVAQAAVWVAQNVAKVAVVVASNVAGAAVSAAAWIAANALMLLGIGLVIAAVVAAVILIVKNWGKIVDGVKDAWRAVYDFTRQIISDVVSFIKSHWALIVGIFLGPIALVVALCIQHWAQVKKIFSDGVRDVEKALSWFTGLGRRFGQWIDGAVTAVNTEGMKIIRWFTGLPGRVLAEVGRLATDLFSSGEHLIEHLADGIMSAAGGALHGAMSFVANTVKSFLPFSPAKQGPLAGSGDPSNSGQSIARNLARGITAGTPQAAQAALKMAASVHAATSGLSASAGSLGIGSALALSAVAPAGGTGTVNVNITADMRGAVVTGSGAMSQLATALGKETVKQLAAAGVKTRLT